VTVAATHVACAADARYLPHTAAMLHSLLEAQDSEPTTVHFLHGPELEGQLAPLERMLEGTPVALVAHRIDSADIAGLPSWGRIPVTMWHRVLLPRLLSAVDRVLYLDVDVLVLAPLAELWELDLTGYSVAAVTNVPEQHRLGHAAELGLSGPSSYFNSGVLLMNLEAMRRDGCSEALIECARSRLDELLWPDQDALNIVLGARRLALHPRWNLMNSILKFPWAEDFFPPGAIGGAVQRPGIIHFEGPAENKPWHVLSENPFRDAYREHRRQTPWPRYRPEGITPGNLLRLARRRTIGRSGRVRP
jgi:lipopolysaccharide biosynthesis glycosyltransferase